MTDRPAANPEQQEQEIVQQFARELRLLRRKAGNPSYRVLAKNTHGEVTASRMAQVVGGHRMQLPEWPLVAAFVSACRAAAENKGLDLGDLGTVDYWRQLHETAAIAFADAEHPAHGTVPAAPLEAPSTPLSILDWVGHAVPTVMRWTRLGISAPHDRPGRAAAVPAVIVTIYLSEESVHDQVEEAVAELLNAAGLDITDREEPVAGSWFRQMRAALRAPAAKDAALVAAHVADSRLVLAQDAAVTATMLQNLGPVIASLQPTKDAVLRVGANAAGFSCLGASAGFLFW